VEVAAEQNVGRIVWSAMLVGLILALDQDQPGAQSEPRRPLVAFRRTGTTAHFPSLDIHRMTPRLEERTGQNKAGEQI
jgi:hypothetical protein